MPFRRSVAIALALGLALPAAAQDIDGAVKARKGQMQIISYNMGILGGMAKGQIDYDAAMAVGAAKNLAATGAMDIATLWPEGSDNGAHPTTRAAAPIWSDAAGFEEKFGAFTTATAAAVDGVGDGLDGLRASLGAVGGTCKGCHQTYRGPKR